MFRAMFPSDLARRKPQVATGCPVFGRDTVLRRPADQAFNVQPIRPGKYVFPEDGTEEYPEYSLVWWDPAKLQLGKEPSFAVRQEELLTKVDDSIVAQDLQTYQNWRSQRANTIERGSRPSISVETVTQRSTHRRILAPGRTLCWCRIKGDGPGKPRRSNDPLKACPFHVFRRLEAVASVLRGTILAGPAARELTEVGTNRARKLAEKRLRPTPAKVPHLIG